MEKNEKPSWFIDILVYGGTIESLVISRETFISETNNNLDSEIAHTLNILFI